MTIDLKDAYFLIGILPEHRNFLSGVKHTSIVPVPFGLALPLLTFLKCMDVALVLLHLQGIDVLNYLGDWLILPSSKAMAASN